MKNLKRAQFGALIKAGAKAAIKKAPKVAKAANKIGSEAKSAITQVERNALKKRFQDIDKGLDKASSPSEKISKAVKPKPKMKMGGAAPKKAMMGAMMAKPMMEKPMMKMGGSLKSVDKAKNPGLAKLPTAVRNKMGYKKYGGAVDMMQAGGVVKSQPKRVGPVDPDGAYTKVQERTLAGKKVAAPKLTKDKELGATKMKKGGKVSKKK